ncbi:DUF1801 domain-containing protein [Flavobacterium sp.]|uniref:DUF1801 domain-containing protein n=1 Tax=Flavobacterium sp. TaxID=239 RepID=UPI0025C39D4A|nr:DUF1801 domain-containing protein [Flavobacterium sp.]MBA4153830.1 hypothetical protein [Flavobacterium sp.]
MQSAAKTPDQYFQELPEERKEAMLKLRQIIKMNLPEGFEEMMGYGMLGYAVPHSIYPKGYHCDPKQPLPFFGMASQKNSINIYHMGIYADNDLYDWFVSEYPKHSKARLDMGKSCIRFKKPEHIPFELIGELLTKISVLEWISIYESKFRS